MILVDSNILMYAAGAKHRFKQPSVSLLEKIASGDLEAAIDAEILQEILHRYRAIGKWNEGRHVYDLSRRIFPVIFAVTADVLDLSRTLLDEYKSLMARDALHIAVSQMNEIDSICSYDRDFDVVREIRRTEPDDLLRGA